MTANDRGIRVDTAGNLIVQNTAANNSLNYAITGEQVLGPILNSLAVPEGITSAWANFAF